MSHYFQATTYEITMNDEMWLFRATFQQTRCPFITKLYKISKYINSFQHTLFIESHMFASSARSFSKFTQTQISVLTLNLAQIYSNHLNRVSFKSNWKETFLPFLDSGSQVISESKMIVTMTNGAWICGRYPSISTCHWWAKK